MRELPMIVLLLLWAQVFQEGNFQSTNRLKTTMQVYGKLLCNQRAAGNNNIFQIITNAFLDTTQCAVICSTQVQCKAFNFGRTETPQCELFNTNESGLIENNPAFDYFTIDYCSPTNPCQNGGTCKQTKPTDSEYPQSYVCICRPGYNGLHCGSTQTMPTTTSTTTSTSTTTTTTTTTPTTTTPATTTTPITTTASSTTPTTTTVSSTTTTTKTTTTAATTSTTTVAAATLCANQTIQATSGYITSLNYPSNYNNDLDCFYGITTPTGSTITFNMTSMEIEEMFDYVNIYDGPSQDNALLVELTGIKATNATYTSTTNEALVYFHSDSSVSRKGFNLTFTSSQPTTSDKTSISKMDTASDTAVLV